MDLVSPATTETAVLGLRSDDTWVQPIADTRALPDCGDPAELAGLCETIRLAFVAALQHLPPRQRVVLILREVLHWRASEVAELLDTSIASVNSALQRARATLDRLELESDDFVTLLREDAAFSTPPRALWLRGPLEVSRWMPAAGCSALASAVAAAVWSRARQRMPGLCQLQAHAAGRSRSLVDPGRRAQGRPGHRDPQLPQHRALRRVRAAPAPGG